MTCRQLEPYIIDFARMSARLADDDVEHVCMARHLVECPTCAAVLERERTTSAALRRFASMAAEPPTNPQQEQALLARFDEAAARRSSPRRMPTWTGAAGAALMLAAFVMWHLAAAKVPRGHAPESITVASGNDAYVVDSGMPAVTVHEAAVVPARTPPHSKPKTPSVAVMNPEDFVIWPGAAAWPPFESGELVRIDLPIDALESLGFAQPHSGGGVVQADVLVGQDGFARAVRLVQ